MKGTIFDLLALVLLATQAAVQAQYSYTTNAGGKSITITGYTGPGGAVTIPTTINNLLVTSIGNQSPENPIFGTNLTSVTIPNNVTSIGDEAFTSCTSLASVTIPSSVTSIGELAFAYCYALTNITIPSSVVSFGEQTFYDCTNLASVTIANGATGLGYEAFYGCTKLRSITIPGSADGIGTYEFYGCTDLTNVTLANGVTSIGQGGFIGCYGLASVTIPDSVTAIGYGAFQNCYSLTNITIPGSVTSIGEYAFDFVSFVKVYFTGNAPTADSTVFTNALNAMVYYLPGTTGWSNIFAGRPAILWNPLIQASGANFGVQNTQFGFNITGTNNFTVAVKACTNLANPVWTPLQTVTLANGSYYFSDPQWTNYPGRFYSLQMP